MTHVFVHGNPETSAIWGPLVTALAARGVGDVVLLSPPGFGAPTPPGWDASRESYRDWLLGQLAALPRPIHLVGHDWGAGHVYSVLAERPDAVDSWAADCAGLLHPDYVWHEAAQGWQTPEVGEAMVSGMVEASLTDKTALFEGLGIPSDVAVQLAAATDAEMGRCILALYRSAAQPALRDLAAGMAAPGRPGLVIIATGDQYAGTPEMAAHTAAKLGAGTVTFDGPGHWWMLEAPEAAADALAGFWSGL